MTENSNAAKEVRYRKGLTRIDSCFNRLPGSVRKKLEPVRALYLQKHAGSALLRAFMALESEIVGRVRCAVQEHFNLNVQVSRWCMLALPRNIRTLNGYLQHVGLPTILQILKMADASCLDVFLDAREMRNRYMHGTAVFNAEQLAEGIIGYVVALNALCAFFDGHPIRLDEERFGPRLTGKRGKTLPQQFFGKHKSDQLAFTVRRLRAFIDATMPGLNDG